MPNRNSTSFDVIVVGGGQSALAAGFHLRRSGLTHVLLDAQSSPGGAWRAGWPSLRLFSPARWSSLPGWLMPDGAQTYPTRDEAIAYLTEYERRYAIPVRRPVQVRSLHDAAPDATLHLRTSEGTFTARHVISATGCWSSPRWPELPGQHGFGGTLLHSADYPGPERFVGRRVLVVGGGNSGAQIFADLIDVSNVTWVTRDPPTFLPDDVDGQFLFEQGTARFKALQEGRVPDPPRSLGDIVMVPPVKAVRDRGRLTPRAMFVAFTATGVRWRSGEEEKVDAVIFATGFRPTLKHLAPLVTTDEKGRVEMDGLHAKEDARVWPLGYGDWTGFASATLIGVGRAAKAIIDAIVARSAPTQA